MECKVINISQGPQELNRSVLKEHGDRSLSFDIRPRLRYSSNQDYVGFQFDILVLQEKTQVYKTGFLIGLAIKDWAKDIQQDLDLSKHRQIISEICEFAWMVATGIVAVQSSFDDFRGIILPTINYKELSKEVLLVPEDII